MNVAAFVSKSAAAHAGRPAVRCGPTRLTYAELSDQSGRFAASLCARGFRRGDRVAVFMRNCAEYAVAMIGLFKAGMIAVPINAKLHAKEMAFIVVDAECAALVYGAEHAGAVESVARELPCELLVGVGAESARIPFEELLALAEAPAPDAEVEADELAWLFYTSGTTGRPKGAMLSHRNLERMALSCLADVCSFQPEDVVLHAAPLSHGSGMYLLPALAHGAENLIFDEPRFDPAALLATVERERVSVIAFLAPTMIVMLLGAPPGPDLRSLRRIIYGGGPIHVEHAREALERFGPVLVQIYGQGESPMTISYLRAEDHASGDLDVLVSAGIPYSDVEVRVDAPAGAIGEVLVRGDVVMRGYWRNEEATATALRGGWLHTGDLGRLGADGRLYLLDRKGDVIITGGANVYPREVEEVLLLHPGVREVAVFGAPDELWGESVVAAVVPRPGFAPTAEELVEHCREHMASFKKPRRVDLVETLPKNAYGKVLRSELREGLSLARP